MWDLLIYPINRTLPQSFGIRDSAVSIFSLGGLPLRGTLGLKTYRFRYKNFCRLALKYAALSAALCMEFCAKLPPCSM